MNNHHDFYKNIFTYLIISLCILAFILQFLRALSTGFFVVSSLMLLAYFTNQSSILVFLSALFEAFKIKKKWVINFQFIALINITITAVIFHIFLINLFDPVYFIQQLLHTYIPLIFFIYYMFFLKTNLKPINELIALIYPFVYFIFVYTIVHPLFGPTISLYYPNEPDLLYVYPFLNPGNYDNGFTGVLQLAGLILFPACAILSILLIHIKQIIEKRIYYKKDL